MLFPGALTKLTEIFHLRSEDVLVVLLGVSYWEKDRVEFSHHAQVVWREVREGDLCRRFPGIGEGRHQPSCYQSWETLAWRFPRPLSMFRKRSHARARGTAA